eukprot:SAG31_NODE_68_length_28153_cov_23.647717_14_plen_214_part_00
MRSQARPRDRLGAHSLLTRSAALARKHADAHADVTLPARLAMTWTTAQEQALKVAVGQRISWPKVAASVNQEHGTEFSVVACQLKWARLNQKVSKKVSNITALQQCYSNTTERGLRAQGKSSTSGLQRQSTTLQFRNMKVHHMHEAVPCPEGTAQPGPLDGLGFVRKIVSQCDTALLNVDVNVIILVSSSHLCGHLTTDTPFASVGSRSAPPC